MSAEQVADGGAVAFVRHVKKLDARFGRKIFDGKMIDGANAGRAVLQRRRRRLGLAISSAIECTGIDGCTTSTLGATPIMPIGAKSLPDRSPHWRSCGRDRHGAGVAQQNRVAIGRRLGDKAGAERAAGAAAISTTICCPSAADILSATLRAITVVLPPGGNGTIKVMDGSDSRRRSRDPARQSARCM